MKLLLFGLVIMASVAADSQYLPVLKSALNAILQQKSAEWDDSGLILGFRHGDETLTLTAGYNDMVFSSPVTFLSPSWFVIIDVDCR